MAGRSMSTEACGTAGSQRRSGEWEKSPYNPDFKYYNEGRLTAQTDKLLALNECPMNGVPRM